MRTTPARIIVYAILLAWAMVCLFPLYWLAITSLKSPADIQSEPFYAPFLDFTPRLDAWSFILFDQHETLLPRILNSGAIGLAATVLAMVTGGMCVYGATRFPPARWLAPRAMLLGILATRILPPAVLVVPLYVMAASMALRDTHLLLILVYAAINLPVAIWLLRPALGTRPSEQEEAAQLDGASHMQIFFGIVLPMSAGAMVAAGFFVFVLCWNEYLFAALLVDNHAMTLPPFLVGQLSMRESQTASEAEELANFSAATTLAALPVLVFASAVQRIIARSAIWSGRG